MALLIDGLIIVLYFVAITGIGLYMGRREKSLHDFALGGRNVPWWAVMASIIAAETSAATFLGTPGEGYNNRTFYYVQLLIGLIIGRVRVGPASKNYVSALFLFMRTLASGTRMFVPAIVMVLAWKLYAGGGRRVAF